MALASLSDGDAEAILYDWPFWARPLTTHDNGSYGGQVAPPGDWRVWLMLAGRGYGKTRTAAEWVRAEVESGRAKRIALVGETAADVRDVMVEGESGLLAISPPWCMPDYQPSKRRLVWPNGAVATTFSGDAPEQLRGPQHDLAWGDEPAKWKYPELAWDNIEFGLRLGAHPRVVASTTPRPIPLIKSLVADPDSVLTTGSTYENYANLAPSFIKRVIRKYEGTRIGRQELMAEILDDNPAALWKRAALDALRVVKAPDLVRVVVAIDPAISSAEDSDETGIVVAALGADGHGYVLADVSLRGTPHAWASEAVVAYHKHHADRVVAEVNQGGDMVETTVRTVDRTVPYTAVHASRGKYSRAEPVAALYEQGRVHHVGMFALMEDQMCQWQIGMSSPDRLDALVWALTELMLDAAPMPNIRFFTYDD